MKNSFIKKILFILISFLLFAALSAEVLEKVIGPYNREYYIILPPNFDVKKRHWVFVYCHGYGNSGEQVKGRFINYDFGTERPIIIAPNFPQTRQDGFYQMLGGNSDKQLIKIVEELGLKYKIHDRFMLWGFSGGSQFSHRFTMKHHKLVLACSSHSGGSWNRPGRNAQYIPFGISCGELDGNISSNKATGRIQYFRNFHDQMRKGGFCYSAHVRAGATHKGKKGPWIQAVSEKLFKLGTTGLYSEQRLELEQEVNRIKRMISDDEIKDERRLLQELQKFKPKTMKYTLKSIDDTDARRFKYKEEVNSNGFTTNVNVEKYLKQRYNYYLEKVLLPLLTKELN